MGMASIFLLGNETPFLSLQSKKPCLEVSFDDEFSRQFDGTTFNVIFFKSFSSSSTPSLSFLSFSFCSPPLLPPLSPVPFVLVLFFLQMSVIHSKRGVGVEG